MCTRCEEQIVLGCGGEGKDVSVQAQLGAQRAGLKLSMRALPVTTELRGTVWHSCHWLQDKGLPLSAEVIRYTLAWRGTLLLYQPKWLVGGRSTQILLNKKRK